VSSVARRHGGKAGTLSWWKRRGLFARSSEKRKSPKLPPPLPTTSTPEEAKKKRQDNKLQRAARELTPLYQAALAMLREAPDVHADETTMRQQGLDKRTFIVNFTTPELTCAC
jgi:transposase-like protein